MAPTPTAGERVRASLATTRRRHRAIAFHELPPEDVMRELWIAELRRAGLSHEHRQALRAAVSAASRARAKRLAPLERALEKMAERADQLDRLAGY